MLSLRRGQDGLKYAVRMARQQQEVFASWPTRAVGLVFYRPFPRSRPSSHGLVGGRIRREFIS